MAIVLDGTTGITSPDVDSSLNGLAYPDASSMGFRNRIINGNMVIDQRNAGASISVSDTTGPYSVDRFLGIATNATGVFSLQRSTVAPTGFSNSLVATVTTAFSPTGSNQYNIRQNIEGFNVADLAWGTANAQAVTLSFWVRSSVTGTFGGSVANSAFDRSYPFSYAISSANTWEQKTITIPGDTTGTWLTDNGIGLRLNISLGAGSSLSGTAGAWSGSTLLSATGSVNLIATSGATFYITGVQLEAGSVATPFERRPFGTELALCQRYYYGLEPGRNSNNLIVPTGYAGSSTNAWLFIPHPVTMRVSPTVTSGSWENGNPIKIGPELNFTAFNVASWAYYFGSNSFFRASAEL